MSDDNKGGSLRFLDFFSGIGGFHLGLTAAGHRCAGFCEADKYAVRSYKAMYLLTAGEREEMTKMNMQDATRFIDGIDTTERGIWYANDVRTIIPGDLPDADLYAFGFPCQAFSTAGRRRGFSDTRGTLIFDILRLAQVRHPRYLLAENVAGLLSHDRGNTFATIIAAMAELGYSTEWQVIDSAAYVPQHRERIYIIGRSGEKTGAKVFPFCPRGAEAATRDREKTCSCFSPAIDASIGKTGNWAPYVIEDAEMYEGICVPNEIMQANPRSSQYSRVYRPEGISPAMNTVNEPMIVMPCISPDKEKTRQNGRRIKDDGDEMFTLTVTDRHGVLIKNDEKNMRIRRLTPRECFRLQGFPDKYFDRARLVNSDTQLYRQIGNSVTVPVVTDIGMRLYEAEPDTNNKSEQKGEEDAKSYYE
ncbi:MAG: DNA (cytosine-5-)-methyltransferase [Clostridiales Family XIII bacterium]|jgi:DNA (cytosine-5)-methyltransferase 1|nr:DNA (cytosine-5-)-methyltransferase [Clostridiales Family XIII bacterium]